MKLISYVLSLAGMREGAQSNQDHQENLVSSIKANNTIVLQELYIDTYPKVEAHILRNNGSKDQAKDIFQEAMIVLWRAIKSERFTATSQSSVQGYLYTIAKNKWIDHLRSSTFKKEVSSEKVMTNLRIIDVEIEDSDYELRLAQATQAFKKLGDGCKKLLSKFYFEKLSLNVIADLFDLDAASARNKKYRCMQKLRAFVIPKNPQKE